MLPALVGECDHDTGRVRRPLCIPCNTGIGHLKDDAERACRAADYVEEHDPKVIRVLAAYFRANGFAPRKAA